MSRKKKDYSNTPETLLSAILVMQEKILATRKEILVAPLSIETEMGDGRIITRANPAVQEYRALVKDFSIALKNYKEITSGEESMQTSTLQDIRSRLKIVK